MGTQVRDAIVDFLEKNEGKYFTPNELAQQVNVKAWSVGSVLARLKSVSAVARQRRGTGNAFEYTAGKRMAFAKKHAGHRFPYTQPTRRKDYITEYEIEHQVSAAAQTRAQTTPDTAQLGLVFRLNGTAHAITIDEAYSLFKQLRIIFQKG